MTVKVKVLNKFVDKNTKVLHKAGEELEITAERLAEIQSVRKDLVKTVEIVEADETAEEDTAPAATKKTKAKG